jgi:hypothetical protein
MLRFKGLIVCGCLWFVVCCLVFCCLWFMVYGLVFIVLFGVWRLAFRKVERAQSGK